MNMITAIIVDDERHCIDRLGHLLESEFSGEIGLIGRFDSFEGGVAAIEQLKPELIFLDVQLNDGYTGFDLLQRVSGRNFHVIFTTAYERYAVQAFRFSALDYLLKPVDKDDLRQAISKLKETIRRQDVGGKFDVLFHNLQNLQNPLRRICVPVMNGLIVVQVSDIIRCESNVNYTLLFLKDKQKLTVARTLKEFEEMLSECDFFRVHNSHLINLAYMKS